MAARFPHDFWQHRFDGPTGLAFHRDLFLRELADPRADSTEEVWSSGLDQEQINQESTADSHESGENPWSPQQRMVDYDFQTELVAAPAQARYLQFVTNALHPRRETAAVFVPEDYEPRYAYPLVFWFHGDNEDEQSLFRMMRNLSCRNCFGVAVRATAAACGDGQPTVWDLSSAGAQQLLEEVFHVACEMRRTFHIHSERVILAGFDTGATAALHLMQMQPEWFGGAAAFCGRLPVEDVTNTDSGPSSPEQNEQRTTPAAFEADDSKRLLLVAGSQDETVPPAEILQAGRLLADCRVDLSMHIEDTGHALTPGMLRHFNQWIIDGICQPA